MFAIAAAREFFVMSDLHLDLFYDDTAPVSNKCHSDQSTAPAQILGRVGCDSPLKLIRSALKQMQNLNPDPEFIIVTGDVVGHYTYDMPTVEGRIDKAFNRRMVQQTYDAIVAVFNESFPLTQVILAYGNNDGYGDYWNPNISTGRQFWGNIQQSYLELNQDISQSFLDGGYYLTHGKSGLPIIVLNSNFFSVKDTSLSKAKREAQLGWLEDQLQEVQEPAMIVMHIPPGAGKYNGRKNWHPEDIARFLRVIERNLTSVSLILAGHLHSQTFQLIDESTVIVHSAISPLFGNNPMFRLYQSSEDSYDFSDYSFDLYSDKASWQLEYNFHEAFHGTTKDFRSLFNALTTDPQIQAAYIKLALGVTRSDLPETMVMKLYFGDQNDIEQNMKNWRCSIEFVDDAAYNDCIGS